MRRVCAIAAIICALFCWGKDFSLPGDVSVEDFSCSGYERIGGSWELAGGHAEVNEKLMRLRDVRLSIRTKASLLHQEKGEGGSEQSFSFLSPECRFYPTLKEIKSDSYVQMKAEGFEASGIGYDIYLEKSVVHIRSKVMLKIVVGEGRLEEMKKLVDDSKKEQPE